MRRCLIRKNCERHPDKMAIQGALTYRQFDNLVSSCQNNLRPYNAISFIPFSSIESIVLIFAALRLNKKICLLNHRNPVNAQTKLTKLFQEDASFLNKEEVIHLVYKKRTCVSNKIEISNEPLIFIPTTGTSANPKIACLSYENFLSNAKVAINKLAFCEENSWVLSLPLYHVAGLSILFRVFLAGGSLIIPQENSSIEKIKGDFISLVPTQLKKFFPPSPCKYKCILVGGAPLALMDFYLAKQASLPIALSYGMTESASQILISKNPQVVDNLYYLGLPDSHCHIRLSKNGQLSIKGKSVFFGYNKGSLKRGWVKTNDILKYLPEYGYAFYARKDQMFISGGENIYPEEIERQLEKCEEIEKAFVVPLDDEIFGKRPVAFIRGKNIPIAKINAQLAKTLPKFKIPIKYHHLSLQFFNGLKWSRGAIKKFVNMRKNCL